MRFSDYLKLGGSNFRRNGFKTLAPITIITIGIIVFNVITGFFSSIASSMDSTVIENDSLKFIEVVATPERELKREDIQKIKEIKGVVTSFPKIQSFVGIEYENDKLTTNLIGIDNLAVPYFTSNKTTTIKDNEIVFNSSLANDLHKGDKVQVSYTVKVKEGEGFRKKIKGQILSLYDQFYITNLPEDLSLATIDYVENINAEFVGLPLEDYRENLSYDFGTVIVKNVENVGLVANEIESMGYDTIYSLKSSQSMPMVAKIIVTIGGVVIILLLVFSGISIASIIGQSLRGRYKEIGIMRAVGYQRVNLIKLFSVEVLYISLISFILSISFSFIIIKVLEYFINRSRIINFTFNIEMNINQVLISFLLIVIVSFLASYRPIVRASSTNITELIRGNAS